MSDCAIGRYIGINAPLHYSVYNLDISADDGAWTEKTRTPWTDKRSITRTSTSDVRPAVANSDRVVQTTSLQIVVVSLGIDSKSEKWVSVRVHVYGDRWTGRRSRGIKHKQYWLAVTTLSPDHLPKYGSQWVVGGSFLSSARGHESWFVHHHKFRSRHFDVHAQQPNA